MDDTGEIEVLEDKGPTTATKTNAFSIAPPQICERWASPNQLRPRTFNKNRRATTSSPWIQTRPANYQRPSFSPIITNVESLSPSKTPIISQSTSLSPYKNQVCAPQHLNFSQSNYAALTQSHVDRRKPLSFENIASMQPNLVRSPTPRIQSVISLSPVKYQNGTNGTTNVTSKIQTQNGKNLQKPQKKFECITIDEDDGNGSDSSKEHGESQDSDLIEKEPSKDCSQVPDIIEDNVDRDCSDDNDYDVKASWVIREDNSDNCESTLGTAQCDGTVQTYNPIQEETSTNCVNKTEIPKNHTNEAVQVQTTPVKRRIKPEPVVPVPVLLTIDDFLKVCKSADTSNDMDVILKKKIVKHIEGCDAEFIKSSSFNKLLKKFVTKVTNDKDNVYVHITDFYKELKARKASEIGSTENTPSVKKRKVDSTSSIDYNQIEEERKRLKIKKLSKFLSKLEKSIKVLEEMEVEWDDDGNSSYLKLQRYKERACKVFDKLCDYTDESKAAGKISKIRFDGTPIQKVNKCIQSYVNHKGEFPDYVDILDVINRVNDDENLKLSEDKKNEMAEIAFTKIGEELKHQRQVGLAESLLTFQSPADPAEQDPELNSKLCENYDKGEKRIQNVIDEFVKKQKEKKKTCEDGENDEDDDDEDDDSDDMEIEQDQQDEEEEGYKQIDVDSPLNENDEASDDESDLIDSASDEPVDPSTVGLDGDKLGSNDCIPDLNPELVHSSDCAEEPIPSTSENVDI